MLVCACVCVRLCVSVQEDLFWNKKAQFAIFEIIIGYVLGSSIYRRPFVQVRRAIQFNLINYITIKRNNLAVRVRARLKKFLFCSRNRCTFFRDYESE